MILAVGAPKDGAFGGGAPGHHCRCVFIEKIGFVDFIL
jgi:hypothetical protein